MQSILFLIISKFYHSSTTKSPLNSPSVPFNFSIKNPILTHSINFIMLPDFSIKLIELPIDFSIELVELLIDFNFGKDLAKWRVLFENQYKDSLT